VSKQTAPDALYWVRPHRNGSVTVRVLNSICPLCHLPAADRVRDGSKDKVFDHPPGFPKRQCVVRVGSGKRK
jgi:hypothetical protein